MTPGEHGEAVTSNRDTLAEEFHERFALDHEPHWEELDEYEREHSHALDVADGLMPTVEAMLAQARAETLRQLDTGLDSVRAKVWDEAVQAVAWAQEHGPDPLRHVADNNPYRADRIAPHDTTFDTVRAAYPYRTDEIARLHPAGWAGVAFTNVRVRDLIPTQDAATFDRLRHLLDGGEPETGDPYPHVVAHGGRFYVHDGHHRYLIALVQGREHLPCRVVTETGP